MLRFDLSNEDVGEGFIGNVLVLSNLVIPGASLAVGIATFGFAFDREILSVGPRTCVRS